MVSPWIKSEAARWIAGADCAGAHLRVRRKTVRQIGKRGGTISGSWARGADIGGTVTQEVFMRATVFAAALCAVSGPAAALSCLMPSQTGMAEPYRGVPGAVLLAGAGFCGGSSSSSLETVSSPHLTLPTVLPAAS